MLSETLNDTKSKWIDTIKKMEESKVNAYLHLQKKQDMDNQIWDRFKQTLKDEFNKNIELFNKNIEESKKNNEESKIQTISSLNGNFAHKMFSNQVLENQGGSY